MSPEDVAAILIRRAQRMNRLLTLATVGAALLIGCGLVYWATRGHGSGGVIYGKFLGLAAGLAFASGFVTSLSLGFFFGRRLLVRRLRLWQREAIDLHHFEAGSLDYVVAMYEKGTSRRQAE